mgnify:FL=1
MGMKLDSSQIPKSYQSYLEAFQKDPEKTIRRLKQRIEKRNAGAVGYFFLAWLYLKQENREKALEAAISAKILAPGSDLMSRLHYFIAHPRSFKAWEPLKKQGEKEPTRRYEESLPIQDLNSLISKLSSAEKRKIQPQGDEENQPDLSDKSSDVEDIVTETLAVIHEKQLNYEGAIKTYKRLLEINPSRSDHYSEKIEHLKSLIEKENPDSE